MQQAIQLINIAPQVANNIGTFLTERFPELLDEGSTVRRSLDSIAATIQSRGGELLNTALTSAASLVNVLMLFVIVPVVAVYLLIDWDRGMARIDELLPRDYAPVIRRLASDIDATLSSFIRGMGTVCLILGIFYAVSLALVGLQFGLSRRTHSRREFDTLLFEREQLPRDFALLDQLFVFQAGEQLGIRRGLARRLVGRTARGRQSHLGILQFAGLGFEQ